MLKINASICMDANYEIDLKDPTYKDIPISEIEKMVKYWFLIDAIENTAETDHLAAINVSFPD